MIVAYRSLLALTCAVGVLLMIVFALNTKPFMIGFGLAFASPLLCAIMEASRRSWVSREAIAAVRESSWSEGFDEGRKTARPAVVPMPQNPLRKVSE